MSLTYTEIAKITATVVGTSLAVSMGASIVHDLYAIVRTRIVFGPRAVCTCLTKDDDSVPVPYIPRTPAGAINPDELL